MEDIKRGALQGIIAFSYTNAIIVFGAAISLGLRRGSDVGIDVGGSIALVSHAGLLLSIAALFLIVSQGIRYMKELDAGGPWYTQILEYDVFVAGVATYLVFLWLHWHNFTTFG